MSRLKLMTIVGTRPEIIRLSECIKRCDEVFDHVLCHTGQNWDYTLNKIFFEGLSLREPDVYLDCPGEHLGQTMGNVISRSYEVLSANRPDALLLLGDTNSALCAISAKRLKIPIFHMEAGNRCFDQNVPEEINRKIIDHTSDVNLPYTEHARRNLLAEGLHPRFIFVTGSPLPEVIEKNMDGIAASGIGEEMGLCKDGYMVLSMHREENVDSAASLRGLINAVNAIAQEYDMPIIFSVHPRTRNRIEAQGMELDKRIIPCKPFGFHDYLALQRNAHCVLSDSGTLWEESAILGFRAVQLRTSTERPEAIDSGICVLAGTHKEKILQGVHLACSEALSPQTRARVRDYTDECISHKVVNIIQSYTHAVDAFVWNRTGSSIPGQV